MRNNTRKVAVGTVVLMAVVGTVATSPLEPVLSANAADRAVMLDETTRRVTRRVKVRATSANAVDPTSSTLDISVGAALVDAQGQSIVPVGESTDGGPSDPLVVATLHAVGAAPEGVDGGAGISGMTVVLDPTSPTAFSQAILAACANAATCEETMEVTYAATGFTSGRRIRITSDATATLNYPGEEEMKGDSVTVEWAE